MSNTEKLSAPENTAVILVPGQSSLPGVSTKPRVTLQGSNRDNSDLNGAQRRGQQDGAPCNPTLVIHLRASPDPGMEEGKAWRTPDPTPSQPLLPVGRCGERMVYPQINVHLEPQKVTLFGNRVF